MSDNVTETHECPSPDCSRTFSAISELTEHINTKHAGEYQRDDWPDTETGRQSRRDRDEENDDENNEK